MSEQTLPPLVCISVLNWNGVANTTTCLMALRQLDYANYRVVVVDNASADDSVTQIRRAFPAIEIIQSETNLGYAQGNKLALDHAVEIGADLFWILNNDAIVKPDALSQLVRAYQQHGLALYGSVPVFEPDGHIGLQTRVIGGEYLSVSDTYTARFRDLRPQRVEKLSGASLLIPVALVEQYGFIDLSFFMYSEEADYSLHLARQGIDSILVPSSVVVHHPRGAHKHHARLKPVIIYYQVRNRLTLIRRYRGRLAYSLSVIKHAGFVLAWLALALWQGKPALSTALFTYFGIRDSLTQRMGKTYAPERYL